MNPFEEFLRQAKSEHSISGIPLDDVSEVQDAFADKETFTPGQVITQRAGIFERYRTGENNDPVIFVRYLAESERAVKFDSPTAIEDTDCIVCAYAVAGSEGKLVLFGVESWRFTKWRSK